MSWYDDKTVLGSVTNATEWNAMTSYILNNGHWDSSSGYENSTDYYVNIDNSSYAQLKLKSDQGAINFFNNAGNLRGIIEMGAFSNRFGVKNYGTGNMYIDVDPTLQGYNLLIGPGGDPCPYKLTVVGGISAQTFYGSGRGLTDLPDSISLSSATITNATVTNSLTAGTLYGNASGLTNLPGNVIFGSLTSGYLTKATSGTGLANSIVTDTNSRLGINTTNPKSLLHVNGRQTLDDNGNFELMANMYNPGDAVLATGYAGRIEFNKAVGKWYMQGIAASATTDSAIALNTYMTINPAGNMGIGTINPDYGRLMLSCLNQNTSDYNYLVFDNLGTGYGDWNICKSLTNDLSIGYGTSNGSTYTKSMTWQYGGNVGIGTTSPATLLEIAKTSGQPTVRLSSGSNGGTLFQMERYNSDGNYINFETGSNNADSLRIYSTSYAAPILELQSGGNIGINETSPVAKLHIQGSGTSGQVTSSFILENSSSGTLGMDITGSAGASYARILYGAGPSTGTNAMTGTSMYLMLEGTEAGRVGIGIIPYQYAHLEVNCGADKNFLVRTGTDWGGSYDGVGLEFLNNAHNTNCPCLFEASAYTFTVGNVGIGAIAVPNSKLSVKQVDHGWDSGFSLEDHGSTNRWQLTFDSSNQLSIGYNSGTIAQFFTTGNLTIQGTLTEVSTRKVKKNIRPITNALSLILQLEGKIYDRIDKEVINQSGLIAEDVEKIIPNVIEYDENEQPSGIKYTKLIPYLIEAIKELNNKV